MSTTLIQVALGASFLILVMTLLAAIALKFFARPLLFSQALLISLIASSVSIGLSAALIVLYYLTRSAWGPPPAGINIETLATFITLFGGGYLITKLAKKYGIEKTGWLGVGARSMLTVLAMSWVVVGVIALVGWIWP